MTSTELLRTRDLVPDFLACLNECTGRPAATWPERYRSRYLDRHHDIFQSLDREGDWSGAEDLARILRDLHRRAGDLAARAARRYARCCPPE